MARARHGGPLARHPLWWIPTHSARTIPGTWHTVSLALQGTRKTAYSSLFQLLHCLQDGRRSIRTQHEGVAHPLAVQQSALRTQKGALVFAYRAAGLTAAGHTLIS